jgi:hypothetical protein
MEPCAGDLRMEIRHDPISDWDGEGEWDSTLSRFDADASVSQPPARGRGKRFEDALLAVATQIPGWGELATTFEAATELPQIDTIMQAHKNWALIAESAGGRWTAAFLCGDVVVGSMAHKRPYEAIVRAFNVALVAAGGSWEGLKREAESCLASSGR